MMMVFAVFVIFCKQGKKFNILQCNHAGVSVDKEETNHGMDPTSFMDMIRPYRVKPNREAAKVCF